MVCAFVFRSLRGVPKKPIFREKEKPISRREESEQEKSQNKRKVRTREEACSVNYGLISYLEIPLSPTGIK